MLETRREVDAARGLTSSLVLLSNGNGVYIFSKNGQCWDYRPDVGLIIAGGLNTRNVDWSTDYGQTKTSIEIPGDYRPGGDLSYACAAIVNTTTVFLAGGASPHYTVLSKTYYLNLDTNTWTRGPDLSQARKGLSCSLMTEPFLGVVMIGGEKQGGGAVDTVDILNLETNEMATGKEVL